MYVWIHEDFLSHPTTLRFVALAGSYPSATIGRLMRVLTWAAMHAPDGTLHRIMEPILFEEIAPCELSDADGRFSSALVAVGWLKDGRLDGGDLFRLPGQQPGNYGSDWNKIKSEIIARDGGRCLRCESTDDLHVHHRVPKRKFPTTAEANVTTNLVTLCRKCHVAADVAYRAHGTVFGEAKG